MRVAIVAAVFILSAAAVSAQETSSALAEKRVPLNDGELECQ